LQTLRVSASIVLSEIDGMLLPGLGPGTELEPARFEPAAELSIQLELELELARVEHVVAEIALEPGTELDPARFEPAAELSLQLELGQARVEHETEIALVIESEIEFVLVIEHVTGLALVTGLAFVIEPVTGPVLVIVPAPEIELVLIRKLVAREAPLYWKWMHPNSHL
jgi:hypothetical protein